MNSSFQPDDLMAILDGIGDAVIKFDGQACFAAMNRAAADIYSKYSKLGLDFFQDMKGNQSGNCSRNSEAPSSSANYGRSSKITSKSAMSFTPPKITVGTKQRGTRPRPVPS